MKIYKNKHNNVFYQWRCYKRKYIWKNLKSFISSCKGAYQRIVYGYCLGDVWNMDDWFYNVIPDMLLCLRDNTNSYPSSMIGRDISSDEAMDKWKGILTDMAESIKAGGEEIPFHPDMTKRQREALEERRRAKLKHGIDLMYQYIDSLWD